jgi:SAM-dependent methyltransferase
MSDARAFDAFADIYDAWVEAAPVTKRNGPFYVELYLEARGPVCELGVGTGRIAVEAAQRGRPVVGVDGSPRMLERCRARARAAGVEGLVTLVEADFRGFTLPEPATLVTIPFHTIGVMLTDDDKRAALARIHAQMAPGGRLVFDHFVFDPAIAAKYDRAPSLVAEMKEADRDVLLWMCNRYDHERRQVRIIVWTDAVAPDGTAERRYRFIDLSWIEPARMRSLLEECGFEVEACYGDYDKTPFDPRRSEEQVWVARRLRTR